MKAAPVKGVKNAGIGGFLAPDQPIPHLCNHAGRCCFGTVISLTPFDVWRMITSPGKEVERFGITSTVDLFGGVKPNKHLPEGEPAAMLGLGPQSKLPVSFLSPMRYGEGEDGVVHCPFLLYDNDALSDKHKAKLTAGELPGPGFWFYDGKPRFTCGLGDVKPVQCDLYPFGRVGEPGDEQGKGVWRFFCDTQACKKCMPDKMGGSPITTQEFIRSPKVRSYWAQTEAYVNLMGFIAHNVMKEEARMVIAETVYNFDQVLLQGGCTWDKMAESRPGLPEHLLQAGAFLAQQMALPPEEEQRVVAPKRRESGLVLPGDPDFKV